MISSLLCFWETQNLTASLHCFIFVYFLLYFLVKIDKNWKQWSFTASYFTSYSRLYDKSRLEWMFYKGSRSLVAVFTLSWPAIATTMLVSVLLEFNCCMKCHAKSEYTAKNSGKTVQDSYLQCVSMFLAKRFVFLREEFLAFQSGAAHLRKKKTQKVVQNTFAWCNSGCYTRIMNKTFIDDWFRTKSRNG